jgi:hypothetical protein
MKDLSTLTHRDQLGSWLNEAGLNGIGVEVGTLYGEYMEVIMRSWSNGVLYCIDPWEKQDPSMYREPVNNCDWDVAYKSALYRAKQFGNRVNLIRGYSPYASSGFNDGALDLVYLDGRHDRAAVEADLKAWWPKIKPGGLFGGHDMRNEISSTQHCEVKDCVIQFAIDHELKLHLTHNQDDQGWFCLKPE